MELLLNMLIGDAERTRCVLSIVEEDGLVLASVMGEWIRTSPAAGYRTVPSGYYELMGLDAEEVAQAARTLDNYNREATRDAEGAVPLSPLMSHELRCIADVLIEGIEEPDFSPAEPMRGAGRSTPGAMRSFRAADLAGEIRLLHAEPPDHHPETPDQHYCPQATS